MQYCSATCHNANSYCHQIPSQNLSGAQGEHSEQSQALSGRHPNSETSVHIAGEQMTILTHSVLSFWSENYYTNAFSSIILE